MEYIVLKSVLIELFIENWLNFIEKSGKAEVFTYFCKNKLI